MKQALTIDAQHGTRAETRTRTSNITARVLPPLLAALFAFWLVVAMLRFYRRFIFGEPDARVWGLADDVYISACFGRTLFSGQGFVWYPGAPHVEGISNPLWSVLLGALHCLPGFTADRLGAYVIALNALLLCATAVGFWTALLRGGPRAPSLLWALPFLPLTAAVSYWSAEGFEIALLAALTFAMLHAALGPDDPRKAFRLGIYLAAGLATRMDFALLALPALLIYGTRTPWRRTRAALSTASLIAFALLLARRAYYGDWLPNTYWLKATGWPLQARLARGFQQNSALLFSAPLPWLTLLIPRMRQRLLRVAPHALAAWAGFGLTVLYSTYVGGDAWHSFAGHDRHTAVGGLLWLWGLAAAVLALKSSKQRAVACALATLIAAWPVVHDDFPRIYGGLFSADVPARAFEREWIAYGKAFREISEPGAHIAVCPAGAIVYFSERGGVDLLGKVDPFVAHLPVTTHKTRNTACWRDAPGHNKEDDQGTFELREPEFSRPQPPAAQARYYQKLKYKGKVFFARQNTSFLHMPEQ